MRNSALNHTIFTLIVSLFSASIALAGSISQVKGGKVLIQLEGDVVQAGQTFYVIDSNGKKVALVKISQVKGDKAIGEVTKGTAILGGVTKLKPAGAEVAQTNERPKAAQKNRKAKPEPVSEERNNTSPSTRKKLSGGIIGGYAMNSMKLTVQNPSVPTIKEDATLTGSSFSVKAFADYDLSPAFTIRVASGYETFSVTGSTAVAICSNGSSSNCTVSFDYLAFEGSAHYNFMTGKTRAWVGLGYSLLVQMSKTVDVPNLSADGSTNQMVMLSGGIDIGLSNGKFIPVIVEYGMFPGSSNVVANAIYVRGGYGFF